MSDVYKTLWQKLKDEISASREDWWTCDGSDIEVIIEVMDELEKSAASERSEEVRAETARRIEIMQAYVDGKDVLLRTKDKDDPFYKLGFCGSFIIEDWRWSTYDYRISDWDS